jgi:hypothetical protein
MATETLLISPCCVQLIHQIRFGTVCLNVLSRSADIATEVSHFEALRGDLFGLYDVCVFPGFVCLLCLCGGCVSIFLGRLPSFSKK